jgi:alpha-tubulin suppressor-like RCC1 family protein
MKKRLVLGSAQHIIAAASLVFLLAGCDLFGALFGGAEAGISISRTTGLITSESGGSDSFSMVLLSEPGADVIIDISSADLTEGRTSSYSLTFTAANWNSAQVVTVTGVDDLSVDGDQTYTILTSAADSGDQEYNGLDPSDVVVINSDDDVAGFTFSLAEELVTTEAGNDDSFTVVLDSEPTENVAISFSSSDLTEGSIGSSIFTFTSSDWNTAQTVTIAGVDDAVDDGDQTYSIISAAAVSDDENYDGFDAVDVLVTNTDDDTAGITVSPESGLITTESGTAASFTVVFRSEPLSDVTIGFESSDTSEGTVTPPNIVFTANDWSTPQSITISGVDDEIADGDQQYSIITTVVAGAESAYDGLTCVDPVLINRNDDGAIAISASDSHTVAVKADGTVWAWGSNDRGQLGDGTTADRYTGAQVSGLIDVVTVAAAEHFTLAVKADGTVWAWGANTKGQLGDGTNTDQNTPVQAIGLTGVVAIAAGCPYAFGSPGYGHAIALRDDGTVWTWGYNLSGQLGDGTTNSRNAPEQVNGLGSVISVAAANSHTVVATSAGAVFAWGSNTFGKLGDGTTTTRSTPVQVTGISDVRTVHANWHRTLAITNGGSLWVWGKYADDVNQNCVTPAERAGVNGLADAATGDIHMLGLLDNGALWSWGSNFSGQLGDGTTTRNTMPTEVTMNPVTAVAAGGYNSFALLSDGSVWGWGENDTGQLGDGTTADRYTPFLIDEF